MELRPGVTMGPMSGPMNMATRPHTLTMKQLDAAKKFILMVPRIPGVRTEPDLGPTPGATLRHGRLQKLASMRLQVALPKHTITAKSIPGVRMGRIRLQTKMVIQTHGSPL